MQSEPICLELDRPLVLVRAVAAEDNMATVERTLPFARTSSEGDPGWKQVGEYTGHGGASAEGVLEHQGNGEGPGVNKEEAIGEERAKLEGLKVVGIRRGTKPGSQMSAKREGIGVKAMDGAGREANGVESIEIFPPRNRYSPEVTELQKINNRPDVRELAETHSLFLWPPPNRGILERFQASENWLAKLNLLLQQKYSSPRLDSGPAKTLVIMQEWQPSPEGAAAASSEIQGRGTADATPRWKTPVKNNPPCNPTVGATCRVIHRDALADSGQDIGRNERKPLNEWPMVKQWVYTLRALLWMVEAELKRESGVTGGMEWFCRRLLGSRWQANTESSLRGRKHQGNGEVCGAMKRVL